VKIEHAARDVTLDQILAAYAAAGGRVTLREVASERRRKSKGKKVKNLTVKSRVQIDLIGTEL
jgi:hypothetical protein